VKKFEQAFSKLLASIEQSLERADRTVGRGS